MGVRRSIVCHLGDIGRNEQEQTKLGERREHPGLGSRTPTTAKNSIVGKDTLCRSGLYNTAHIRALLCQYVGEEDAGDPEAYPAPSNRRQLISTLHE
jgi:hypothetical protein